MQAIEFVLDGLLVVEQVINVAFIGIATLG
jgi:hypothetical protein